MAAFLRMMEAQSATTSPITHLSRDIDHRHTLLLKHRLIAIHRPPKVRKIFCTAAPTSFSFNLFPTHGNQNRADQGNSGTHSARGLSCLTGLVG
jgi:hypothetical protein